MKILFKVLLGVFAALGFLSVAFVIIFFFLNSGHNIDESECQEKIISDTTSIPIQNGIEDYEQFRQVFFTNNNFQKSRTKFPIKGKQSSGWSVVKWTSCNWKTLTPYYMDTITYGFRKLKYYTDSPYEKKELVYDKLDSLWNSSDITKLTFKLETSKWYLAERIGK